MRRGATFAAGLALLALAGCARPHGGVAVSNAGDVSGGVSAGRVAVGAGPGGARASARVVDTGSTAVTVGTDGASVGLRPRGAPVRLILGTGGVGIGF
ncbi:hypothetical protein BV509_08755 [Rhodovulum sulfidophilum]|uniref:hypothetical protein n=1 Tax=Rhodovulum visakhapatnamense TaxID=364297 RepID=UPI000951B5D3|nr:hypothetical protein [Rhodovulum visakhapatnamense]MBL3571716.1 hypothetical protein [Rhodovulum visakhapatnamense]OLS44421.1 hypothetical protein BV509_08755 [Rhodovulum sulfidophilum]